METTPWEVVNLHISDAYIAGFLDGDGSVVATIIKQNSDRYPNRPYRLMLKVNFTQHIRYRNILYHIKQHFGDVGSIRSIPSRNLAELVIQDRKQLKTVLIRVLPHLVLKYRQATLALEIISVLENSVREKKNAIAIKDFRRVFGLANEIRGLNSGTGGKKDFKLVDPVTTRIVSDSDIRHIGGYKMPAPDISGRRHSLHHK